MRLLRDPRLRAVALAVAAVGGWLLILQSDALAARLDLGLYFLTNLMISAELFDVGVRLYLRNTDPSPVDRSRSPLQAVRHRATPYQKLVHLKPYALVASVHNAEDDLDEFLREMKPYQERFWFIDDASTDRTKEVLQNEGWRVVDGLVNRHKPGAVRRLLASLPDEIETVLILDPDMSLSIRSDAQDDDLESIIFDFQRSGCTAACPRIRIRTPGLLSDLQELEYLMAFELGRASLLDHSVTSGAALYDRRSLRQALERHSLSVYAEDLENTVILLSQGHRIYYERRIVIATDAKTTLGSWFSQRVGWFFGLLKVFAERRRDIGSLAERSPRVFYHFIIYTGFVTILFHPLRIIGVTLLGLSAFGALDLLLSLNIAPAVAAADPIYFLIAVGKYIVLAGLALLNVGLRRDCRRLASVVPLYPLYAMAQVAPISLGFANYCSFAAFGRRLWSDHYQSDAALLAEANSLQVSAGDPA